MPDQPDICHEAGTPRPVRELVVRFTQADPADEAILRELLGHFDARNMNPESFCQQLVQLGMPPQEALAIKELLECEQALREFLKPKQPLGLKAAKELVILEHVRRILLPDKPVENQESEGIFRKLCRLAVEWGFDPETYRRLLITATMTNSRASEIKRVLECPPARDAFVAKTKRITWQEALDRSRQAGQSEEEQRKHQPHAAVATAGPSSRAADETACPPKVGI